MNSWRKIWLLLLALMAGLLLPQILHADTQIRKMPATQSIKPQITPKIAPTSPLPGMTAIQPQTAFPELISVAPATLRQGQSATLNLTGRNLSKDMVLIMGPGVSVSPLQQVGDKILLAPVTVTDEAAPGVRTISVQYKGATRQSQARLTVTAVQAATTITAITPSSIAQGESRELTISGTGLEFVRQMNFGPGLSAQLPKPSGQSLRVSVTAAPDATPGQRAISYSDRTGTHTSRLPFMVTINPQPEPPGKAVQPIQTKTPRPPMVMTITPSQWTQGGEYEVTVQGANLSKSLETRFAKGIEIKKLTVTSATNARMTVRVADQAPLGRQWLEIRPGPDSKWARSQALAEVQAKPAATISPQAVKTDPPKLLAITPTQWEQNGTYEVTLQGAALPETLQARFGKDIVVKNFTITSAATATFTVQVPEAAPPGPRPMEARLDPDTSWEATRLQGVVVAKKAAVVDVKPELPGLTLQPQLSFMSPNRWYPGKSYEVTVLGDLFASGMSVELGADISVSNLKVANPTRATMTVAVGAKASPGPRSLRFRLPGDDGWRKTGASGLVKAVFAGVKPPMVVQPPLADIAFAKGVIELLKPEYGNYWLMENAIADHGIPKTTDETRFVWKEKQEGRSQWFELRIVDKQGTVRMKREIKGSPLPDTFYPPDAAFIAELFDLFGPGQENANPSTSQTTGSSGPVAAQASNPAGPIAPQAVSKTPAIKAKLATSTASGTSNFSAEYVLDPAAYVSDNVDAIDCFWEVAGLRKVTTQHAPSTTQSQGNQTTGGFQLATSPLASQPVNVTQDVEVAVSERWPLRLPAFSPSGLACSTANTQLDYRKSSYKPGEEVKDHTIYVGDSIRVSGEITLDECPWALGYDMEWGELIGAGTATGQAAQNAEGGFTTFGATDVKAWKFHNLFIDWGDGSYDLVTATPTVGTSIVGSPQSDTKVPPSGKIFINQTHVYRYSNKFPVRVFVLPLEDAGTIGSIVRFSKAPEPPVTAAMDLPGQGPLLASLDKLAPAGSSLPTNQLASDAGASALSQLGSQTRPQMPKFEPPGGRAFLLYCNPQIIDIKADPAALGPLHLEKIEIIEFSGQSAPALGNPDATNLPSNLPQGQISVGNQQPQSTGGMATIQAAPKTGISQEAKNQGISTLTAAPYMHDKLQVQADAYASTCDAAFLAKARLTYYGLGKLILRWRVDGEIIEESTLSVGPSPIRTTLKEDNTYAEDILRAEPTFDSPPLPLEVTQALLGKRTVTVEAALAEGEKKYGVRVKEGTSGTLPIPEFFSDQLDEVVSTPKTYAVSPPKPGEPCTFRFPVAGGKHFLVTSLRGRAKQTGNTWSGQGTLLFDLPDSASGQGTRYVDINFQGWTVDDDGLVQAGAINLQGLNLAFDKLPGVTATLQSLTGAAGQDLQATMDLKVKDSSIRLVSGGGAQSPAWTGVKAPLIPESGWYAAGQQLPLTKIGWSLMQIESADVRLDLSRGQGSDPSPATAIKNLKLSGLTQNLSPTTPQIATDAAGFQADTDWVGVHLGQSAVIHPFLFQLDDMTVPAKNWQLTDNGFTGAARCPNFSYVLGAGSIAFDSIDIVAGNNQISASYKNVRIEVPWPKMTLQGGSGDLVYSQGQSNAEVGLQFDTAGLVATEDYGTVVMKTQVKEFLRRASGWGIVTDTAFTFRDEQRDVATVDVNDLFFNMDGLALFAQDAQTQDFGVNVKTRIGDVEANIHTLQAKAGADRQGAERLDFAFRGDISFPGLSKADVDVMYTVQKPLGKAYMATGPKHSKFTTSISYPDGRPLAETSIAPEIRTTGGGLAAEDMLYASLQPMVVADASGAGAQDTFGGAVETRMFGMDTPVKAIFRYGTSAGQGYWLTHANVGDLNAPIFPGVNLQAINGGLALGFSKDVFSGSGNPLSAMPNNPGAMVYSAGISVSAATDQVFEMTGQITVLPQDAVYRMDFSTVKILTYKLDGGAFFEYANSAFSGKVWGSMSMYGGAVSLNVPKGLDTDLGTAGLYFGPDNWEIYCGRQKSPIKIHFLIADVNGYMHLGQNVGLRIGGGLTAGSGKICLGIAAAEAYLNTTVGIGVSPGAHLSADFSAGAGVAAWVPSCDGHKFSLSQSIDFHVEAMPVHLRAGYCIDCGWFGEKCLNVTLI